jgi:beta-lactamase regulating signal transducer with metallopeptidase domain
MNKLATIDLLQHAAFWVICNLIIGILIGSMLYFVLRIGHAKTANMRYGIAMLGQVSILLSTLACFVYLMPLKPISNIVSVDSTVVSTTFSQPIILTNEDTVIPSAAVINWEHLWLVIAPWLGIFWIIGVILFSLRYLGGHAYLGYCYYQSARVKDEEALLMLERLKNMLSLKRNVQLRMHQQINAPFTFGFWRPVIMIPLGFFTGLTAEQAEAVLLHELHHIKHHDYLINSLLAILEILCFFNPVVWWLNAVIKQEREYLRDDQSVKVLGNPLVLAKALTQVEANRQLHLTYAMHFAKNTNQLTQRIMRLFEEPTKKTHPMKSLVVGLLLLTLFSTGFVVKSHFQAEMSSQSTDKAAEASVIEWKANNGVLRLRFTQHSLQLLNKTNQAKAFLDREELTPKELIVLQNNELYFYYSQDNEMHFVSKQFAEQENLNPYVLVQQFEQITVIRFNGHSHAFELVRKPSLTELVDIDERVTDKKDPIIGYENFTLRKDSESNQMLIQLIDETKQPLILFEEKQIDYQQYLQLQRGSIKYHYHLYGPKDGIQHFGEKATYGAIVIKPREEEQEQAAEGEELKQGTIKITQDSSASLNPRHFYLEDGQAPLFYWDGKKISEDQLIAKSGLAVAHTVVLMNDAAKEKYGEKAPFGAIEFYTTPYNTTTTKGQGKFATSRVSINPFPLDSSKQANTLPYNQNRDFWLVVNGQLVSSDVLDNKQLSPNDIKELTVLKGDKARSKYGADVPKDGVIEITLHKNAKIQLPPYQEDYIKYVTDRLEELLKENSKRDIELNEFLNTNDSFKNMPYSKPIIYVDNKDMSEKKRIVIKSGSLQKVCTRLEEDENGKNRLIIELSTKSQ